MKGFFKIIKWVIWDFSGLRYIWGKILTPVDPDTNRRRPITFLLWTIGIYVAFFGVASQRYENRIDIIENRANAIFAQLSSPAYKKALSRVSIVQNMPCPQKPEILSPKSVLTSLFGEKNKYDEMVQLLKETIENWKASLDYVNLSKANLENVDLEGGNLEGTFLVGTNLREANLRNANLHGAQLREADLYKADLDKANLEGANLRGANLLIVGASSDTQGIKLHKAYELFSKASTLYKSKLNSELEQNLKINYPDLFVELPPGPATDLRIIQWPP